MMNHCSTHNQLITGIHNDWSTHKQLITGIRNHNWKTFACDIEVLPNYFALGVRPMQSEQPLYFKYELSEWCIDTEKMLEFLSVAKFLSFHNIEYDSLFLKMLWFFPFQFTNNVIYGLSKFYFDTQNNKKARWKNDAYKAIKNSQLSNKLICTFKILERGYSKVSLKQAGIHLEYPRLNPFDFDPHAIIEGSELPKLYEYLKDDLNIQYLLTNQLRPEITLRADQGARYGLDLFGLSDNGIANAIYDTHPDIRGRTDRDEIHLSQIRLPIIEFITEGMQRFTDDFYSIVLKPKEVTKQIFWLCVDDNGQSFTNYEIIPQLILPKLKALPSFKVEDEDIDTYATYSESDLRSIRNESKNKTLIKIDTRVRLELGKKFKPPTDLAIGYSFGKGGIHTIDQPLTAYSGEFGQIIHVDVSGYYPMLMTIWDMIPAHLRGTSFKKVLQSFIDDKKKYKLLGEKSNEAIAKLCGNGTYGNYAYPYSDKFFDLLAQQGVAVNGQFLLVMLSEQLMMNGIKVLSLNTDGIVIYVQPGQRDITDNLCEDWQLLTQLNLDLDEIETYSRSAGNAYAWKQTNGKIKRKGMDFLIPWELPNTYRMDKAYQAPVTAHAFAEYMFEGVPVEETIRNYHNPYHFLFATKFGKQFRTVIRRDDTDEQLHSNHNRYYCSLNGGTVTKIKENGKEARWKKDYHMSVCNVYDANELKADLDYESYITITQKLIDKVSVNILDGRRNPNEQ